LAFWFVLFAAFIPKVRRRLIHLFTPVPSVHQSHLACLDAFRGLAALFIAVFHTWQWTQPAVNGILRVVPLLPQGTKAVPVFVVLSGLLIYRSFQKVSDMDGFRKYLNRRFFRIFPVYAVTILASSLFVGHHGFDASFLQYLTSEIFMLRSLGFPAFSNPPAWSLYVEVMFYMLLPVFVITTRRSPLFWAVVAVVGFSMENSFASREFELWKYFFFGIICAEIISRVRINPVRASLLATFGIVWLLYDFRTNHDLIASIMSGLSGGHIHFQARYNPYTISLGLAVLTLFVGVAYSPFYRRLLEVFPLRMLGAISYSLYLWHPFLIVADFPITFKGEGSPLTTGTMPAMPTWYVFVYVVPALITVSATSYLLLERPFLLRRIKNRILHKRPV
jgi:peptidoglycan/LPS O-acetylase OafA/YrhL